MQKKYRRILIGFVVSMVAILVGYVGAYYFNENRSKNPQIYEFDAANMEKEVEGLSISMSVSKNWRDIEFHPKTSLGAQYDFIIHNDSDSDYARWTAVITFSGDIDIDSSWNGIFSAQGNVLTFSAQAENTTYIKPGGDGTFGAIIYSEEFLTMEHVTLTGYRTYSFTDMFAYKVLNVILIIWTIGLICAATIMFNYNKYMKQQKKDAKIIKQSMDMYIGFIDAKDSYTRGHSTRVAEYATEVARRMRLSKDNVDKLYYITLMHDCGKIGVPDAVLKKPGKLTDEEFEQIKMHTTVGDEILKNFTAIDGIREGAHYHHERYDGRGYPEGLKGERIPLFARIICVADSYDAMSSDRCYRKHLEKDIIISEFRKNKGKQFDPELADIMITMIVDGTVDELKNREAV